MNKLIFKAKTLKSKGVPIAICLCFSLVAIGAIKSVAFDENAVDGNLQPAGDFADLDADHPLTTPATTGAAISQAPQPSSRISEAETQRFQSIDQESVSNNLKNLPAISPAERATTPSTTEFSKVEFSSTPQSNIRQPDSDIRAPTELNHLLSIGQPKAEPKQSDPGLSSAGSVSQASMTSDDLDRDFESSFRPDQHGPEWNGKSESPPQISNERIRTPRHRIHQIPKNIQDRVQRHLEYGQALARRGSVYSATNEFIHGLKLIVQVWDYQASTTEFSESLNRGLVAAEELEDFLVTDTNVRRGRNAYEVIRGHATQAFSATQAGQVTTIEALQRYMRFSQESLADAAGNEPIASKIYYAWGKLHLTLAREGQETRLNHTKATVLFRAAYSVDSTNSLAANELAVMLARNGNLDVAKNLLVQSLSVSPLPVGWKNLSSIHKKLGEPDLAQRAWNEYRIMTGSQRAQQTYSNTVQWVSPQQFREVNGAFGYPDEQRTTTAKTRPIKNTGPTQKWNRKARSGSKNHWGANSKGAVSRSKPIKPNGFGYATRPVTKPVTDSKQEKKSAKQPGFFNKLKSIF